MAKFRIKKIMQYTEVLEVEASSIAEANEMAFTMADEFERNNDDSWQDTEVKEISD
jgi:hypothetical protein